MATDENLEGGEMATRRWVICTLCCMVGLTGGAENLGADKSEVSPLVPTVPHVRTFVFRPTDWGGDDASVIVPTAPEERRDARAVKRLSLLPQELLDRFPTGIVESDAERNHSGILIDVDPGVSYSMPLLDKECFDRGGERLPSRFLYDKNLPRRHQYNPEGRVRLFPDFGDRSREPLLEFMPPLPNRLKIELKRETAPRN